MCVVSQAYNLVWLSPRFTSGDGEDFHPPFQEKTKENILAIARANPDVDVRLWVDSKRLTKLQMQWLQEMVSDSVSNNLVVQDLRTIPSYDQCPLYNKEDTSPDWRANKHSLIWRQVDAARILACLQGEYAQSFYTDCDITRFCINSDDVQSTLSRHGIVVSTPGGKGFENQILGFDSRCRGIFNLLYISTLRDVSDNECNGYSALVDFLNFHNEIHRLGIDKEKIGIDTRYDGTAAIHPNIKEHSRNRPPLPFPR